MAKKVCTHCHQEKHELEFSLRKGGKLACWCRQCRAESEEERRTRKHLLLTARDQGLMTDVRVRRWAKSTTTRKANRNSSE